MPGHASEPDRRAAQGDRNGSPRPRYAAAEHRRQRHPVLRAGGSCDHRQGHRTHVVRPRRLDGFGRRCAKDPGQGAAGRVRQVARRAEADPRRRSFARGVRILRTSGSPRRNAVPGGSRRLRYPPGLCRGSGTHEAGGAVRERAVPTPAQGAGAVRGRHPLRRTRERSDDLRRRPSARLCRSWLLCPLAGGSRVRPRMLVAGATDPLACNLSAREFRAYAVRSRWIRTANDSYFTAMTYPEGLPSTLQPSDIHDATWGALSAVYGGALHPTAEGHAAMADAALSAVHEVLGLPAPTQ